MPRNGRNFRKVKRYTRHIPGVGRRVALYGGAGYQLSQDMKYLKGMINAELHEVTSTFSAGVIADTGSITNLAIIAQGDTISNRSGNSILVRWINGQLVIRNAADDDSIRFIVFVWKDETAPVILDILQTATPFSHLANTATGNYRDARVRVLYNRLFSLTNGTSSEARIIKFNIDMNPANNREKAHTLYPGAGTVPANKGVWLLTIGTQDSNTASMIGTIKTNFYDN